MFYPQTSLPKVPIFLPRTTHENVQNKSTRLSFKALQTVESQIVNR